MKSQHRVCAWLFALLCVIAAVGCHLLPTAPSQNAKADPEKKYTYTVPPFVFQSDVEISKNQPLFHELSELREQVVKDLHLPPSNTRVQVHIFADQAHYETFMKAEYRDLPKRRAFFVEKRKPMGGVDLLVYTYWSDKIRQDLRHELTHASLHSVLKGVPIWLDEGLAEYFEMPPGWNGVNYEHMTLLKKGLTTGQKLNMARLEQLEDVHDVNPSEYREGWAWVHFMLHNSPQTKAVLVNYLKDLRNNPKPGPLRPRLVEVVPSPEVAVERHLFSLDSNQPSQAASLKKQFPQFVLPLAA